jgi:hypothetical protein
MELIAQAGALAATVITGIEAIQQANCERCPYLDALQREVRLQADTLTLLAQQNERDRIYLIEGYNSQIALLKNEIQSLKK